MPGPATTSAPAGTRVCLPEAGAAQPARQIAPALLRVLYRCDCTLVVFPGISPDASLTWEPYTGWIVHWGEPTANTSADVMIRSLDSILSYANDTGSSLVCFLSTG